MKFTFFLQSLRLYPPKMSINVHQFVLLLMSSESILLQYDTKTVVLTYFMSKSQLNLPKNYFINEKTRINELLFSLKKSKG